MDWVYNVPIKFMKYDLNEFKDRLNSTENALLIASKRVINTFEIDTSASDNVFRINEKFEKNNFLIIYFYIKRLPLSVLMTFSTFSRSPFCTLK